MSEYEKYLQERLQLLKNACEQELVQYKEALKRQENRYLLSQIQQAELNMNRHKDIYVQRFRESMAELAQMRKKDSPGIYKRMYDRLEESHKKALEIGFNATQKIFGTLIEYLKSHIQ